ncbi:MAG: dihydropteroate synthase [Candidatus Omnitrophota bacterium]
MKNLIRVAPLTRPAKTRQPDIDIEIGRFRLAFSVRTYVMGILNVTPDSFSDGGKFFDKDKAVKHAMDMAREGADIIDVGGESARPGSTEISVEEELDRVMPVVEAMAGKAGVPVSIDTRKGKVAEAALRAGAKIVNDISGFKYDPYLAAVTARYDAAVILMHMRGTPLDMQKAPRYKNVMKEVAGELQRSIKIAVDAGVKKEKVIIDPGIGFSKTAEHNLVILNRLDEIKALGYPVCVGTSRKSFIGKVLGIEGTNNRLAGTLATCVMAIMKGANILRVHDVREVVAVSRMTDSVLRERAF